MAQEGRGVRSLEVREGDWEREREKLSVSGRKGERNEREKKKN